MTACVNLFGGPGIGKSTLAAELFAALKKRHVAVEITTEFAKDLIWDGRAERLSNQIAVLGGQWERISRLDGKVDLVVNDSPLPLCCIYAPAAYPPAFHDLVWWTHHSVPAVNYVLTRHGNHYQAAGRVQDAEQARRIDDAILSLLDGAGEPYTALPAGEGALATILEDLIRRGLAA